jgi:hypothetical protein
MTVYYSAAVPQGTPQGCDVDWTQLSGTDLTAAALQNNINSACSTVNYDITDPLQLGQCQANMINLATSGNLTTGNINSLMQQIYLYNRLDQYYQSGNTSAITNYNFLMNASGSMQAAQEWIPILKAALTAIAVALIPFLCIFIPTPICGKALNLMFGMFLWLALWGLCDAIIHQFAVSYAYDVWDAVRNNNLGMDALYFFPNMTVKALAMFGTLRLGGLLLATALTTMLTKFGGSVMGMLAGNIIGQLQASGASAEWKTTDPAGRAQSLEANTKSLPTEAWAASHSISNRGGEVFASKSGGTEAYETMSLNFGGPQGAAHMKAMGEIGREVGFAGKEMGMENGPGGLPGAVGLNAFDTASGLNKTNAIRDQFSPESYGQYQAAPDRAFSDVAAANGMSPAALRESMSKFDTAMGYGEQKSVESHTGIKDGIVAGNALGQARGMQDTTQMMRANQLRAAANYAAPDSWKSNPELYDSSKRELTDKGVARFLSAREGLVSYSTDHGRATQELTSDGQLIRSSEEGTFEGEGLSAVADRLDKAGLHKEAAELRKLGAANMGVSYDAQGHPVTAVGSHGGKVEVQDRGIHDEGLTLRRGDNIHIGNDTRTGDDTHVGNTFRKGDDVHVGDTGRHGNDADFGDKSRTGDLETLEHFQGNVDGHNFTNATAELRGNTFSVYGETADGRWEAVSGYTSKDAAGNRQWTVMKGRDDSGMSFTPQSAMDSVLNKHSVPESAMKNYQTKTEYAGKIVEGMLQLSKLSSIYTRGGKGGASIDIGGNMLGNTKSSRSFAANLSLGSEHSANEQQTINTQFRDVMKVLDRHDNTPQGRKAAAEDIGTLYRDYAGNTGDRFLKFHNGGPWVPK